MKQIIFEQRGTQEGGSKMFTLDCPPNSRLVINSQGVPRMMSVFGFLTAFDLLPAATVAAGTDKFLISLGTGTEVIARAAKGGVNVKTQASSPADNDNAMLIGIATTAGQIPITAASQIRFESRVNLTQITQIVFGCGLDENITSPIGSATAGDGAQFLFDPLNEMLTGIANYATNFILAMKVNGTDTYLDSGIAVNAGRDYDLVIQIGVDLKPKFYIDGVLVGTGASALTSGDSVMPVVGVQASGTPDTQKDFDVRFLSVERQAG